ncbi:hypothetical protein KIW84_063851 [Lathyrus oleraceus]|uniref:hAT-like transposase RNase-H fold domain-containing protein n=1 Tax=Pisum sativum TaxID=3888 RepID=A0A9D4WAL6_PEA|nr:hypothetical protein KIW84_063851 [Pisum sativum]
MTGPRGFDLDDYEDEVRSMPDGNFEFVQLKEDPTSTSLESLGDSQSPPKDGEECLNVLNPIVDLNANTNEEPLTNESTPENEVVNEENVESSDIVIQKSKRKKTSLVWDHFKKVELKNGKNGNVYTLVAQQKKLNFQPAKSKIDEKLSGTLLMNSGGKYDHERQREATAHWIMMHEHAFSIVEEEGFHFMMKCSNISYEKISRKTLKNDCIAVYEAERKKKLKSTLRTKRILSFVHVPPPRRGVDIADAIFKCLKDWGSEYPTANLYLAEVFRIKLVLDQAIQDESDFMKEMEKAMKGKFDKYWSQCNLVMSLASVLDPRIKMMGVNVTPF